MGAVAHNISVGAVSIPMRVAHTHTHARTAYRDASIRDASIDQPLTVIGQN